LPCWWQISAVGLFALDFGLCSKGEFFDPAGSACLSATAEQSYKNLSSLNPINSEKATKLMLNRTSTHQLAASTDVQAVFRSDR
jgi:hypothetical protein